MSHYTDTTHEKAPFNVRFVDFACHNCCRRWSSANGSLQDFQKCKRCYTECYPVGFKIKAPKQNRETYQGHNKELCGKCERLGRSCMMLGNNADDNRRTVTNADGEEVYLDNTEQRMQNLELEENQQINERYQLNVWPELATYALQYVPTAANQVKSSKIKPVQSNPDSVTSEGITAAETLNKLIQKARQESNETSSEEEYEEYYTDEYDCNKADEVWEYSTLLYRDEDYEESDHFYYSDGELDCEDDISEQGSIVDSDKSDKDELEQYVDTYDELEQSVDENEQYLSSQNEEAYFNDNDDMSLYEKELSNRLLRRGRKHAMLSRKNIE